MIIGSDRGHRNQITYWVFKRSKVCIANSSGPEGSHMQIKNVATN